VIAPPVIQNRCGRLTAPNNHLRPSPDRGMVLPRPRGIGSAGGLPAICGRIVASACASYILRTAEIIRERTSAEHDHFRPGPDRGVIDASGWRISSAGGLPGIPYWVIGAAGGTLTIVFVERAASAPDDHFSTGPDG